MKYDVDEKVVDLVLNKQNRKQDKDEFFKDLHKDFIEMGQLKSDFDIEKFTIRKEGMFLAHNFHFLMRQYSLALFELRRFLLNREERFRKIKEYNGMLDNGIEKTKVVGENGTDEKWVDIELARERNELESIEVTMVNKLAMCRKFEIARQKLIELNGGTPPSNKEYQKEVPSYWKWFLEQRALQQVKANATGIGSGIWENIEFLERQSLLNPEFQVKMLNNDGMLDIKQIELNMELEKQIDSGRVKKLLDEIEIRDKKLLEDENE